MIRFKNISDEEKMIRIKRNFKLRKLMPKMTKLEYKPALKLSIDLSVYSTTKL